MATPPKITKPARLEPLQPSEFSTYDIVSNQQLDSSEFSVSKLNEFVWRYIATDNMNTRGIFRNAMSDVLKERINKKLRKIYDSGELSSAQKQIVKDLLENEFNRNAFKETGKIFWDFTKNEFITSGDGEKTTEEKSTHILNEYASININIPYDVWRFLLGMSVTGLQYFEPGEEYQGVRGALSTEMGDKKGIYTGKIDAAYTHAFDVPFNTLTDDLSLAASFAAKGLKFNGNSLSVIGSYNFILKEYSAPLQAAYLPQGDNKHSATVELNYGSEIWGLVANYVFSKEKLTTLTLDAPDSEKHDASLLAKRTWGPGNFLNFGLGGAALYKTGKPIYSDEFKTYDTANLQLKIGGGFKIGDVSLTLNAQANAEEDKADFDGWYFTWNSSATLFIGVGRLSITVDALYSGRLTDLLNIAEDKRQTMHNASLNLKVEYQPNDWIILMLNAQGIYGRTIDYMDSTSFSVNSFAEIDINVPGYKSLWWYVYGSLNMSDSETEYERGKGLTSEKNYGYGAGSGFVCYFN